MDTRVDGYVPRKGEGMSFLTNRVSEGYFATMGIPIVRGGPIEASHRDGGLPVAVVNEAFARRFWGSIDAVGRRIEVSGHPLTIIGVAADGKYEFTAPLDEPSPPFVYLPFAQWGGNSAAIHVRAIGDPLAHLPAIRRVVSAVEPAMAVLSPTTLETYSSVPLFPIRVGAALLTALGGAALVLAALGLYAVIGYAVAQRQREIGVRMALGATPARLVAGFLMEAGHYAGAGALAGFVLAALVIGMLSRGVPYLVPRITPAQALPFALAVGALTIVALLAALVPARRATRVNPATALRAD
jgi:ABC-type antimicrobial peptide transport system permease subunit